MKANHRNETEEWEEESEEELKESDPRFRMLPRVIVNVAHTQYDVIREVLEDQWEFHISEEEEGEWDLRWMDTGVTVSTLAKMKDYQKINHYPGMYCISRKNHLGRNLMKLRKLLPEEYNFFPPTWILPGDWVDFRKQFTKKLNKTFICKPEAMSQGKGIFLTRTHENICAEDHYVVQRYIHKPYLIDGLKVYGCDPLRVFLYHEGLARLATEKYHPPCSGNLDNMYVHLTNYAINKNHDNFEYNTDAKHADVGHKRSLEFVWNHIDEHGGDSAHLRIEIKQCITKTLCAVQPLLVHSCRAARPHDFSNSNCFEVLGFDILIDHKLKPWLLEVNHTPSFATDTPFDQKVKSDLLNDVLGILNLQKNTCLIKMLWSN